MHDEWIDTLQVRLVPLGDEHLPDVATLVADADVVRFTRFPAPLPPGFIAQWYARYRDGRADGTCGAFAIADAANAFLGLALAVHIDGEAREAELGYMLAPSARGRGVATDALRQLSGWAFGTLGAFRLQLLISVDNQASSHVAERAGYILEGVLRSLYVKQDLRSDTEVWSLLPSDARPTRR
ncbi:MAG: Acetyltransferase family protein [Actinomycetia bacterium]|nr:Acetyltransferase family protein [Actinomycetes bacterium]